MATTATDNGGSGVDGAAAPVVLGGGGDVGEMRRSVARSRVVSVELGGDWSGGDEAVQSPVLCSSGGQRTRSGATASGAPGQGDDVKEVRQEVEVRVKMLGGAEGAHRRREWRRTEAAAARCVRRGRELRVELSLGF